MQDLFANLLDDQSGPPIGVGLGPIRDVGPFG